MVNLLNGKYTVTCNRCGNSVIIEKIVGLNDLIVEGWHVNTETDCEYCPICNGGTTSMKHSVVLGNGYEL